MNKFLDNTGVTALVNSIASSVASKYATKDSIPAPYTLPMATNNTLGGVIVDGSTITIDDNGIISAISSGSSTSAGSATQPVYFSSGKPVACTYTLGKSVPSNAVFTDTTYTLPKATTSALGGVMVDGSTITIDSNGKISSSGGGAKLLVSGTGSSFTFTGSYKIFAYFIESIALGSSITSGSIYLTNAIGSMVDNSKTVIGKFQPPSYSTPGGTVTQQAIDVYLTIKNNTATLDSYGTATIKIYGV